MERDPKNANTEEVIATEDDDDDAQIARARWALRLLARNQDTPHSRRAAQRHLEWLGALMMRQTKARIDNKG